MDMNKPKVKQQSTNIPLSRVEMICKLAKMHIKLQRARIISVLETEGTEEHLLRLITKCLLECLAFLVKFKLADITEHGYLIPSKDSLWDIKGATSSTLILKHLVTGLREFREYSGSLNRVWAAEELQVCVYNDLPDYVKVYTGLEHYPWRHLLPKILEKKTNPELCCHKQIKRETLTALAKEFVRLDNIFRNLWGNNESLNDFLAVQYGKITGKSVTIETQSRRIFSKLSISVPEVRSHLLNYLGLEDKFLRIIWVESRIVWHPNLGEMRPYLFSLDDTIDDAHSMFAEEVTGIRESRQAKKLGLSRKDIHPLNDRKPYVLTEETFREIEDGETLYLLYVWRKGNKKDSTNFCTNSFWKPTISAM